MSQPARIRRYGAIMVALHWVIGLAIIWMLYLGYWMNSDAVPKGDRTGLIQLHKSVGIIILLLVAFRICWRLTQKLPKWPDSMGPWERRGAALGHYALYALMIVMPLSGWAMVSSSPTGLPTFLFKTWHWPHLPFIQGDALVNAIARFTHNTLPWVLIATIGVHVLAVIKHAVIDKENILPRMWFASWRRFAAAVIIIAALAGIGVAATCYKHEADTQMQAAPAAATATASTDATGGYVIDYASSKIEFGFTHADAPHTGVFGQWTASIDFDEADLSTAKINAIIDIASAKTGDNMYDGTLPEADWLDAQGAAKASYIATNVERVGEHQYVAHGTLILRRQAKPLDLAFTVTPGADNHVAVTGTATVHRLDYGIGAKSDGDGAWVGKDITLKLTLAATKKS